MTTATQERQSGAYEPTLRDMIALEIPEQAKISPDGAFVAFTLRTTNWRDNCYEQRCMLVDTRNRETAPLSRTGSVQQIEWVDANTLALLRTGPDKDAKPQIWLYEGLMAEGWPVTEQGSGVDWFQPFAGGFLYQASQPQRDENKERSQRFGTFTHFEQEESASALYYVGLAEMKAFQAQKLALTEDEGEKLTAPVIELSKLLPEPCAIQSVAFSSREDAIYFTCWPHDDLVYYRDTTSYCITVDVQAALDTYLAREGGEEKDQSAASANSDDDGPEDLAYLGTLTNLHLPAGASIVAVSPDGRQLLVSHRARDDKMYTQEDYWTIDCSAAHAASDAETFLGGMTNLSAGFDREIMDVKWGEAGIFGFYPDGTMIRAAHLGEDGQVTPLDFGDVYPESTFHVNAQGQIGFVGCNAMITFEVFCAQVELNGSTAPVRLTDLGSAMDGWHLGTVETIRWTSVDGTEIEGVLRKPENFDPTRCYPLVLVVHGGPTWLSPAYQLYGDDISYYPTVQFANKDVLVLKPNYRGSIGRGQAFTELNVNNLGVGDLWDIESAVDHLVDLGWVDPDRVGCMGWSQGGYISAFAGLHSKKFKAVSVGAGISDWYTYHISNDIPDFTTHYLSGSPFRDRALYEKTAPISNIADASTPMLIQHGSEDRRVPLSNAMELYRGLKEMDVPVELFVYPGFGHPITKPRENHAVMFQNLAWFSHYLLDEELKLE